LTIPAAGSEKNCHQHFQQLEVSTLTVPAAGNINVNRQQRQSSSIAGRFNRRQFWEVI
jgi:hypothetical protein